MYIYYPSCNFAISSPQTAKKVREYLKQWNADGRKDGYCKML